MDGRARVLATVVSLVPEADGDGCVRVGVDGADGAGKTRFADELEVVLRRAGRPVVRVSLDDFHNVRAIRYRRGRHSPAGYWAHAFNYQRLWNDVLDPLGPGGSRSYRPAAHDLATDRILELPPRVAPEGAVLMLDGVFLHRDELAAAWNLSVFLRCPLETRVLRLAERDGTPPDPADAAARRYVEAHRRYVAACDPESRATVVIDNAVLAAPRLLKVPPGANVAATH